MSNWTHVAAVIRFDFFKGITPAPDLGHTAIYPEIITAQAMEQFDHDMADCDVPCGSEGSLNHSLRESTGNIVATIWGDLRAYDDVAAILEYLELVTVGRRIRAGVAEITVDHPETRRLFVYDCSAGAWR